MAVTDLVRAFALRSSALRLLDLGGVEQRSDDRRGSDADRDTSFHQLCPPLFIALVGVAHSILTLLLLLRPYAERRQLERAVSCAAA
jgi:hypothetical protein